MDRIKNFGELIYKYRYCIALVLFVLCVIFGVNGSSIGCWLDYLGIGDDGVLLGTSRPIRSDEWALSTPFAISQYSNDFGYFSDIIRATNTDVFLEYGTPVLSIAEIFRPFHWGYLFLPLNQGLSFYWMGRYITLFMVSFEMAMLITNKKKLLSVAYAFLILFAPVVQWWFAINGLVEMLIYSQLSIVLFYKYLNSKNTFLKAIYAIVIAICAGGFVLTMYPSWMVPIGYLLLGLIIWVIIESFKKDFFSKWDVLILVLIVAVFGMILGYVFYQSWDTIQILTHTAYPGARFEKGGDDWKKVTEYMMNIWIAFFDGDGNIANAPESAFFIDFFPLCYFLTVIVIVRDRIYDKLLIILSIVSIFLLLYCCIGYPGIICKISLLSNCQGHRVFQVWGITNLMMLFRAASLLNRNVNRVFSIILVILVYAFGFYTSYKINLDYLKAHVGEGKRFLLVCIITIAIFAFVSYLFMRINSRFSNVAILVCCIVLACFSSFTVNPLRLGAGKITDAEIVDDIKNVVDNDKDAIWVVCGTDYPMINLPIVVGAKTINSTNIYPALERWMSLDQNGKSKDVYNRYAHINIYLKESGGPEFKLNSPDSFTLIVTLEDLKKMGVSYIIYPEDYKVDSVSEMYNANGLKIGKLV